MPDPTNEPVAAAAGDSAAVDPKPDAKPPEGKPDAEAKAMAKERAKLSEATAKLADERAKLAEDRKAFEIEKKSARDDREALEELLAEEREKMRGVEAKVSAAVDNAIRVYHVAGPGSVFYSGKVRIPGTVLRLTDEEASSLGDAIAAGEPSTSERRKLTAGSYKVTAAGNIMRGKIFTAGDTIVCTEVEANEWADRLSPL